MIPQVIIASYVDARDLIMRPDHDGIKNMVSIGDPDQETPAFFYAAKIRKMRIEFDDISTESGVAIGRVLPTEKDVAAIIAFNEGIKGKTLFHCVGGISRSAASAMIFMAMQLPKGKERAAAEWVKGLKWDTNPNRKMIEHADKLLDRKGQLMWALEEVFGRGGGFGR